MNDRSSHRAGVLKYDESSGARVDDQLAAEEPLEIRIGSTPLTVMMRTPGHERELALGFLFGEGIIRCLPDVAAVNILPNGEHPDLQNILDVDLAASAPGVDRRWQRNFVSASSCGLCGVSTIDAIHQAAPPLADDGLTIDAEVIYGLDARLRAEFSLLSVTTRRPSGDSVPGYESQRRRQWDPRCLLARPDRASEDGAGRLWSALRSLRRPDLSLCARPRPRRRPG